MLGGMRAASQNWIGRSVLAVVMGFIILSFAIWGIGDIFRNFGSNELATVGKAEITAPAYRNAYQSELQRLQRQARRAITNDQARAAGLDRQVLQRLIADAALDQRASAMGLAVSDADIVRATQDDPAFKGPSGAFDQARFNDVLRENGLTERGFLADQRRIDVRRQLIDALVGDMRAPMAALEAVHALQAQTRSIDVTTLTAADAGDIPPLDAAALQAFYDERPQGFRAPEYRRIATLAVTPALLAKPDEVTQADAHKRYDETAARYASPETRTIEEIAFASLADAQAAQARIAAGQSFADAAKESKLSVIALGDKPRAALIDKAVAQAAFALPAGGVSEPVTALLGPVLLRVAAITPPVVKPFEEVAGDIKREIAAQRAEAAVQAAHDRIEDQRSSGKPLAEAAKAAGLDVRVIEAIDATGRDKQGALAAGLPDAQALLKAAFASDVGVDNDTIATRDHGYIWFEVAGIEPTRRRSLEEVRGVVEAAARDDEIARRLAAKAAEAVKAIDGGAPIEGFAKQNGLALAHLDDVKRGGATGLSPAAIVQVFNVAEGKAGTAMGEGGGRIIFKVTGEATPPLEPDSPQATAIQNQYRGLLAEDIAAQYVAALQKELGVRVNQAALRAAASGGGGGGGPVDFGGDE